MSREKVDKSPKIPDKVNLNMSRAILPFIMDKKEWIKPLSHLNKVTTISHSQSKIKQKKFACFICKRLYQSALILLIHLQLTHADEMEISKYQIDKEHLFIHFTIGPTKEVKQFYLVNDGYFVFKDLLKERIDYILKLVIKKIKRKANKKKKIYYHSGSNIFDQIGSSSQIEDSQQQLSSIEMQLEKMRINDIIDINETDKHFFIKWNQTVHRVMKGSMVITRQSTLKILEQFMLVSKNQGIKRVHLVMHLTTLWSAGKITANDMVQVLIQFDEIMQQ